MRKVRNHWRAHRTAGRLIVILLLAIVAFTSLGALPAFGYDEDSPIDDPVDCQVGGIYVWYFECQNDEDWIANDVDTVMDTLSPQPEPTSTATPAPSPTPTPTKRDKPGNGPKK